MTPQTAGQNRQKTPPAGPIESAPDLALSQKTRYPAGILWNARIVTSRGVRNIQDLKSGDYVITRSNGIVPVHRVERQSLIAPAVYVIAGSLGHYQNSRDTLLPAGQPILVRDWRAQALGQRPEIFATALSLVDREYVRDIGLQVMTLYQVYCGASEVLYADGMELGSADMTQETSIQI